VKHAARTILALIAGGVFAAACESTDATAPVQSPSFDVDHVQAIAIPNATAGEVMVCKDAPRGGYEFTAVANTPFVTVPANGRFALQAGQCKTISIASAKNQSITTNETAPPPTMVFDHVEVYRFTPTPGGPTSGAPSLVWTQTTSSTTVTPIGPDNGWVIVYYNVPK
jgi:hypothetical protein